MKILCECGETLELVIDDDPDESEHDDEGQYCITQGNIELWRTHYTIGFVCNSCCRKKWIFV